jgi:hypothetical protein
MHKSVKLYIRGEQFQNGEIYVPVFELDNNKVSSVPLNDFLAELDSLNGEIITSGFIFDPSVGVKTIVFCAVVSFPVSQKILPNIQKYTKRLIKLD